MKKVLALIFLLTACEFRITDETARESLDDASVEISFGNLLVADRNIHYAFTNHGKDRLAVFIHGSPGSWNSFIDFFAADSLRYEFDILSIDRPGFGGSDFGIAEPSMERQANQMNEVIKLFYHRTKVIVGHSLGGPVVARMAMDFPTNYNGVVLVAPSIDPELEEEEWYRKVIDTQVGAFFTPKEFEVSNDEIMSLKKELEEMLPMWKLIEIPTILIHGTEDSLVPKENALFADVVMSDSILETYMLEDANHFIPWSHPHEIIKAIRQLADR